MAAAVWRTAAQGVKAFRIEGFLLISSLRVELTEDFWRFGCLPVCVLPLELPAWRPPLEQATATSLSVSHSCSSPHIAQHITHAAEAAF